jgi:hypothetical protein
VAPCCNLWFYVSPPLDCKFGKSRGFGPHCITSAGATVGTQCSMNEWMNEWISVLVFALSKGKWWITSWTHSTCPSQVGLCFYPGPSHALLPPWDWTLLLPFPNCYYKLLTPCPTLIFCSWHLEHRHPSSSLLHLNGPLHKQWPHTQRFYSGHYQVRWSKCYTKRKV